MYINRDIPYQLEYQDINMLASPRFTIDPAPSTACPSQRQWLHLQSTAGGVSVSDMQKKRKILQPHSHHQQQHPQLRPHSGSSATNTATSTHMRKSSPPALMIPFFENRRDPGFSSLSIPEDYDAVSPRTTTISTIKEASSLPPPLLRPCHVCHRKPSTKVMLDAYADCDLCGERACYICLRECSSSNCHSSGNSTLQPNISTVTTPDEYVDDMTMTYCNSADIRREDGYLHTRPHSQATGTHHLGHRKVCSMCAIEGLTDAGDEIVWCVECVRREEMNQQRW